MKRIVLILILINTLILNQAQAQAANLDDTYRTKLGAALMAAQEKTYSDSIGFQNSYNINFNSAAGFKENIRRSKLVCELYAAAKSEGLNLNSAATDSAKAIINLEKKVIDSIYKNADGNLTAISDYEFVQMDAIVVGTFIYCNRYFNSTYKIFSNSFSKFLDSYLQKWRTKPIGDLRIGVIQKGLKEGCRNLPSVLNIKFLRSGPPSGGNPGYIYVVNGVFTILIYEHSTFWDFGAWPVMGSNQNVAAQWACGEGGSSAAFYNYMVQK